MRAVYGSSATQVASWDLFIDANPAKSATEYLFIALNTAIKDRSKSAGRDLDRRLVDSGKVQGWKKPDLSGFSVPALLENPSRWGRVPSAQCARA